jgi:AbrB family looped-hinge helix DNA binding protein
MALVKMLRGGMLTLPADTRRSLRLGEGDYLQAEVVDGKVELRPVAVVDRQEAWRKFREAQASVRYIGPEPRPSPEEEEQWIFDVLAEARDRRG